MARLALFITLLIVLLPACSSSPQRGPLSVHLGTAVDHHHRSPDGQRALSPPSSSSWAAPMDEDDLHAPRGLGTRFAERRSSYVTHTHFERAHPSNPFAQLTLFYNDWPGLRDMVPGPLRLRATSHRFGDDELSAHLQDHHGSPLPSTTRRGRRYTEGRSGDRYVIVIRNHGPRRFEIIASVDGLDVIDGQRASMDKRGYLLEPYGTLAIEGFRRSGHEVAAFRFGHVTRSYASLLHDDIRNVGVIGVAAFDSAPLARWRGDDTYRRRRARPFAPQH